MSVEFDQENNFNKNFERTISKSNGSKMNTYLIKKGYAKNEKQANLILLGISLLCILITIFVFYTFVLGNNKKPVSSPNAKIIQEYRAQGLTGKALMDKMREDRKAGILK